MITEPAYCVLKPRKAADRLFWVVPVLPDRGRFQPFAACRGGRGAAGLVVLAQPGHQGVGQRRIDDLLAGLLDDRYGRTARIS